MSTCPVPKCGKPTASIFCDEHWRLVSAPVRKVINHELRTGKRLGRRTVSRQTKEAIDIAWAEIRAHVEATQPQPKPPLWRRMLGLGA